MGRSWRQGSLLRGNSDSLRKLSGSWGGGWGSGEGRVSSGLSSGGMERGGTGMMKRKENRLWEGAEELLGVGLDNLTVSSISGCPRGRPGGARSSGDKVIELSGGQRTGR